jgi:iron complex transport system ATP-binding protein
VTILALSARGLTASHRRRVVLHGIDLTLPRRTVVALIGPNASGKSTLVRCLAGAHRPERGRVTVDEQDVQHLNAREASHRIAFLPQDTPVAFAFTVRELIGLASNGSEQARTDERERRVLRQLDLEALEHRSLLTLSGGERQRASAARVFLQNSDYLLLDEPTAHLDLRHQALLLDAARQAAHDEGRGVLIVLHDLNLAAEFADLVVLLCEGRIAAAGTPDEVLTFERLLTVYGTTLRVSRNPESGRPLISLASERINFTSS